MIKITKTQRKEFRRDHIKIAKYTDGDKVKRTTWIPRRRKNESVLERGAAKIFAFLSLVTHTKGPEGKLKYTKETLCH